MQIDLSDIIETVVDIEIPYDEALNTLKQTLRENIEAGAPFSIITNLMAAARTTLSEMEKQYDTHLKSQMEINHDAPTSGTG